MRHNVCIMNFTGVYERVNFLNQEHYHFINCKHLNGTNCYCDSETEKNLNALIKPYRANGIHFIDSGNYHYMTYLWAKKITTPFALVLFDNHTDMQLPMFGDILSCGGWVREMLKENKWLESVYIIGVSQESSDKTIASQNVKLFTKEMVHYYTINSIIGAISTNLPLYISIDKDVLSEKYVKTNWNQGDMSLTKLLHFLYELYKYHTIIGTDICGEEPLLRKNENHYNLNEYANFALLKLLTQLEEKSLQRSLRVHH